MKKHNDLYLVPVDFTAAAASALKFTLELASNETDEVVLLHIIKSERERLSAEKSMKNFVEQNAADYENLETKIVTGKLAEEIGEAAKILEAKLIILGTHCVSGISQLFKNNAFEIIENCPVPLIVVQEQTSYQAIKKIMMTVDLDRESIQIIKMAAHLSKLFNSEIILVSAEQTDSFFKSKRDLNLKVCLNHLIEHNIPHSIKIVSRKNFTEEVLNLCKTESIDMLAATFYKQHVHVFTDSFVRTLANNEFHIPLLTMDELTTHSGGQFSAMFG